MAETSKRNWPWKKKPHDKIASSPESIESSPRASHNSKFFDEQDVSKILSDHARVSDEAMTQWQHSESKLKQLSDKLHASQTELTTKDMLVKQHAKVAEEAVTGWEKAEAEASAVKKQLDTTINQKLATEDRVSHLDGALKECMRQLRHVREEQEVRIHETIVKKTREYDELRQDMEAKLAEAGHHLHDASSKALECRSEARAMSIALQERTKALAEVTAAKASAETELKILQVQLKSMEKEISTLKYELHLLRKEVEIRNLERECERKVAENADKNQLQSTKKLAKLEAECQKLRILVRKKLPGPAAVAQMKIEVDALSNNSNGVDLQRRRSIGRSVPSSPRDLSLSMESTHDSCQDTLRTSKGAEVLSERMAGMDEELKMVKEALAKRDGELQISRLMCAKTASKLSTVEEQLEAALGRSIMTSSHLCSPSQEQGARKRDKLVNPCYAAPDLLVELAEFNKGSHKGLDLGNMDLMDDFAEMEKLAMATENGDLHDREDEASEESYRAFAAVFEKKLLTKQMELDEANCMSKEVSQQLTCAEEQLSILQSRNCANEAALVLLQEKLDKLCDKQGEDDSIKDQNITKQLEDLVEAQSISVRAGAANEVMLCDHKRRVQNAGVVHNASKRSTSSRTSSERKYEVNEAFASALSDAESESNTRASDLLTTVQRVVQAVKALAQAAGLEHEHSSSISGHPEETEPERQIRSFMHWKNRELDCRIQSLIGISNRLLQGETEMVEFLVELTAVVNYLARIRSRNLVQPEERMVSQVGWPNLSKKEDDIGRVLQAEGGIRFHGCADDKQMEIFQEDLESDGRENAGSASCFEIANRRIEGVNNQFMSDGINFVTECELHELSIANTESDRDMLMLLNKVVVLEEELEDERQHHQEIVAKYHELQQNIHSGGSRTGRSPRRT